MIAIRHGAATGKAVKESQRTEQGVIIDLHATLLAQQQCGQDLSPGRIHQAAVHIPGANTRSPVHPTGPELLAQLGIVTVVL